MTAVTRAGVVGLVATVVVAIGCAATQEEQGELIGGVVGGIIGAQVGEGTGRTVAIIVGTLAGSMIGRRIGESMDEQDRVKTAQVLNDNRSGQTTTWTNPDNGSVYVVTPTRTYDGTSGPCREFTVKSTVGGVPDQDVYGTACLQADGSWRLQP